jgi:fused signal recognition particle receptor
VRGNSGQAGNGMSFFGKLKERLFKSSSKLDEGLEKIVVSDLAPEDTVT